MVHPYVFCKNTDESTDSVCNIRVIDHLVEKYFEEEREEYLRELPHTD
jgi:hypothetical protein